MKSKVYYLAMFLISVLIYVSCQNNKKLGDIKPKIEQVLCYYIPASNNGEVTGYLTRHIQVFAEIDTTNPTRNTLKKDTFYVYYSPFTKLQDDSGRILVDTLGKPLVVGAPLPIEKGRVFDTGIILDTTKLSPIARKYITRPLESPDTPTVDRGKWVEWRDAKRKEDSIILSKQKLNTN